MYDRPSSSFLSGALVEVSHENTLPDGRQVRARTQCMAGKDAQGENGWNLAGGTTSRIGDRRESNYSVKCCVNR